jgi:alpha-amylase
MLLNLLSQRVPHLVINHMTGGSSSGVGTGGSSYDGGAKSYPGVPFSYDDFNSFPLQCPNQNEEIVDYQNIFEVDLRLVDT